MHATGGATRSTAGPDGIPCAPTAPTGCATASAPCCPRLGADHDDPSRRASVPPFGRSPPVVASRPPLIGTPATVIAAALVRRCGATAPDTADAQDRFRGTRATLAPT